MSDPQPDELPVEKKWLGGVVILLMVIVAYLPVIHCGFIWDDDGWVVDNPMLRDFSGLRKIWFQVATNYQYYPLVYTSFWLEHHLWGANPLGYHLVNVFLHGLGSLLLWGVLRKLEIKGAWFAAAIFALHPVQVESVAWVTERKNVLSGVFYFASALFYLRFSESVETGKPSARRLDYAAALVLFVAALMSKTVACSLPVALVLVVWWKKGRLEWRDLRPTLPFFMVGLPFGLTTAWLEKRYVGAEGGEWSASLADRFLIAGRALWFYAGKLIWPSQLTFSYARWDVDARVWWQWLFPAAATGVVVLLWIQRRRLGRGPLTAVLFFAVTLFPALGFVNVYPMRFSFVADHFQYLASVGLLAILAVMLAGAARRWLSRPGQWISFGVLLALLGVLTWRQTGIYRNLETLWRDTLAKNPRSFLAHHNLASCLQNTGRIPEAIDEYRQASQIYPDCITLMNLAWLLNRTGQFDEALNTYHRAFTGPTHPSDPDYLMKMLVDFAVLSFRSQQIDEAIRLFNLGLQIQPTNSEVCFYLANALSMKQQYQQAIPFYEVVLKANPDSAGAHCNLGTALGMVGQVNEAIRHLQRALQLDPNNADIHNNLGSFLVTLNRTNEAIGHFKEALRLRPGFADAERNLSITLSPKGHAGQKDQPPPR